MESGSGRFLESEYVRKMQKTSAILSGFSPLQGMSGHYEGLILAKTGLLQILLVQIKRVSKSLCETLQGECRLNGLSLHNGDDGDLSALHKIFQYGVGEARVDGKSLLPLAIDVQNHILVALAPVYDHIAGVLGRAEMCKVRVVREGEHYDAARVPVDADSQCGAIPAPCLCNHGFFQRIGIEGLPVLEDARVLLPGKGWSCQDKKSRKGGQESKGAQMGRSDHIPSPARRRSQHRNLAPWGLIVTRVDVLPKARQQRFFLRGRDKGPKIPNPKPILDRGWKTSSIAHPKHFYQARRKTSPFRGRI